MCGLSGYISSQSISLKELSHSNNLAAHRGPDGEGYTVVGSHDASIDLPHLRTIPKQFPFNLGLGHRRLSIIDLTDAGIQPFIYNDRHLLVFNGEIFNYIELREELKKSGHKFKTQTDTEVVCAAFAEWGELALNKMNGMWAMAWLDCDSGALTLSRDRFGIKPLYYTNAATSDFAFASEAKQLLPFLGEKIVANYRACLDFLGYGLSDHDGQTFFEGILELPAGHMILMNLRDGKAGVPKKWYKPDLTPIKEAAFDYHHALKTTFDSSIDLRLRADVPIGSCLSGGIDSSSIVATVYEKLQKTKENSGQKTFSFVPNEKKYSEKKFIDLVTDGKNLIQHVITPSSNALRESLTKIIYHQDFPFPSTSIFAQWCVFEKASIEGVKVMLDGQGADEVLGGYHSFLKMRVYSLFRQCKFFELIKEMNALKSLHGYGLKFTIESIILGLLPTFLERLIRKILKLNNGEPQYFNYTMPNKNLRSYKKYGIKNVHDLSRDQISRSNLPMLLRFEDRNSMAHAIEARVPFLDYRIVELALRSPEDQLVSGGKTKNILRLAMKDRLPREISNRHDKMGFVTPEEVWLKDNSKEFIVLMNEFVRECHPILKPEIAKDFESFCEGKSSYNGAYWRAISLGLWRRQFKVSMA
jgi:asparagine synthase (glutamine-hydrolysing)